MDKQKHYLMKYLCLMPVMMLQLPLFSLVFMVASALLIELQNGGALKYGDFQQQILCQYAAHGINPYAPTSVLDGIGPVPEGFSTSPWGLTIGNIFYPAFIPIKYGCIYILLLSIIVVFITSFVLIWYFGDFLPEAYVSIPVCVFMSTSILIAILNMNAAGIIACFIILAILLEDKHSVCAGFLIGFSLVKPQMCALIFLTLLLERKLKPIVIACAMCVLGFINTCIMLQEDPVTLMLQFINSDVGLTSDGTTPYYGIMSFLSIFNMDDAIIKIISAIVGVILMILAYGNLKKAQVENVKIKRTLIYAPAIICSQIWAYGWNLDKGTLILMIVFFLILFMHISKYKVISYCGFAATMLSPSAYHTISDTIATEAWHSGTAGGLCAFIGLIIILILFNNHAFINELNEKFPKEN